ncbi:MAG: hypothetical protein H8E17_02160 [Deltaproteobacteria bacterium]|nr:hypothetical protein [Deltaproteobacteria bacterium]
MVKKRVWFLGIFLILFATAVSAQQNQTSGTGSISFSEFSDNMDTRKKTALHVKNYWQTMKGQEVSWTGTVVDAKSRRGKAQVLVANKERPRVKGYNIVLVSNDIDAAASLEIGQKITFSGVIHNYRGRRGRPIIVTLIDVTFSDQM